ncbi:hypothetical protein GPECTOR_45g181 [Gonium pectorale]|uniref:Uncharacterized protein n=1 Tax=Gonium pectorale TaxID=33097 RepID=A0A150G918_GONPE|nr:hypothetical protein GPECTOR_45g181 [Gonium pectorale]|eukprot:KXZ46311.1 hypothetical protein GPECTOR_45g181 [Gonium pectorale]
MKPAGKTGQEKVTTKVPEEEEEADEEEEAEECGGVQDPEAANTCTCVECDACGELGEWTAGKWCGCYDLCSDCLKQKRRCVCEEESEEEGEEESEGDSEDESS